MLLVINLTVEERGGKLKFAMNTKSAAGRGGWEARRRLIYLDRLSINARNGLAGVISDYLRV